MDLYAKIYCGEQAAFYVPPPPPPSPPPLADLGLQAILRNACREPVRYAPTKVSVLLVPRIMAEVGKAARGIAVDRTLLDCLELEILAPLPASNEPISSPAAPPASHAVAAESTGSDKQPEHSRPQRHTYKREKHLRMILDVLRNEGFNPQALPPRQSGMGTPKKVARQILVEKKKLLSKSQFNHGWDYGRKIGEIAEVASGTV